MKTKKLNYSNLVGLQINGWTCYEEGMSGALHWYHPDSDFYIVATPNWLTMGLTDWWVATSALEVEADEEAFHLGEFPQRTMSAYLKMFVEVASNFA